MTECNLNLCKLTFIIICTITLVGCEPGSDWAKRFDTAGRVWPNFRFSVTLEGDVDTTRLYPTFERTARNNGFVTYQGQPVTFQHARDDGVFAFHWLSDSKTSPLKEVNFSSNGATTDSFTVILYNNEIDNFQVEDWEVFAKWKDEVLPQAFPDATIEVAGHPAAFTDEQYVQEFAQVTGVPIPDSFNANKQ